MYHLVSEVSLPAFAKYTVSPTAFAAQMAALGMAGFTPVSMDELARVFTEGSRRRPARPVVITFDDGFRDTVRHAVPVLLRHRFTAVFYLVAGLAGRTSEWLEAERDVSLSIISWDEARILERQGFQCGSHSLTHRPLTALPPSEYRAELSASKQILEQELGRPVEDLAYPHGLWDDGVRAAAREAGYRSACSVRIARAAPEDDRLALPRVPILGTESLLDFVSRVHSAASLREAVAGTLGRLRAGPLAGSDG